MAIGTRNIFIISNPATKSGMQAISEVSKWPRNWLLSDLSVLSEAIATGVISD